MRNIYWTELGADTYASLVLFYFEYSEKLEIIENDVFIVALVDNRANHLYF
jgi:hypothetical protein